MPCLPKATPKGPVRIASFFLSPRSVCLISRHLLHSLLTAPRAGLKFLIVSVCSLLQIRLLTLAIPSICLQIGPALQLSQIIPRSMSQGILFLPLPFQGAVNSGFEAAIPNEVPSCPDSTSSMFTDVKGRWHGAGREAICLF